MSVFPSKVNYATGDILTATDMNEIGQAINLLDGAQFAAGKNKVINGDFGVWQRGTSFSNPTVGTYLADRWRVNNIATLPTTATIEQQTFTAGTAPVTGYEGTFFLRSTITTVGSNTLYDPVGQRIEDVRTFAGQTVTFSFWAKADSSRVVRVAIVQNFGSGGSGSVTVADYNDYAFNLTTAWQRFSMTVNVPSISGKTIGTNSFLVPAFRQVSASGSVLDIWGVQLEAASTASPFQTATGTKQGELAACRYYYKRNVAGSTYGIVLGSGSAASTTLIVAMFTDGPMRIIPNNVDYSNLAIDDGSATLAVTNVVTNGATSIGVQAVTCTVSGATAFRPYRVTGNNNAAGYIGITAEL
jgi:hypothetical protein